MVEKQSCSRSVSQSRTVQSSLLVASRSSSKSSERMGPVWPRQTAVELPEPMSQRWQVRESST